MNKLTPSAQDYLAALPLSAEQQAQLAAQLPNDDAQALEQIHQHLGEGDPNLAALAAGDVAQASVKERLRAAWPDSLDNDQQFDHDAEGRTILKAAPPIIRSRMFPEEWRTNPVARFWDRLMGRHTLPNMRVMASGSGVR